MHEHLRGRAVRVRHFRGDTELEPIFEDNHYDFNYQQIRYANRQITVLQQDTILVECEYDTSNDAQTTYVKFINKFLNKIHLKKRQYHVEN